MVSGMRLARRKDIVSRPPEKILSTAAVEPVLDHVRSIIMQIDPTQLTGNRENVNYKLIYYTISFN